MNNRSILAVTLTLFTWQAFSAVFVDPKLNKQLRTNGSSGAIRTMIHFADKRDIEGIAKRAPKGVRVGAYLASELEKLTLKETAPLRSYLGARQGKGVEEVTVIWGTNSLRVLADAKVLTQVLAMNAGNVESMVIDEPLPVGEMLDDGNATMAPKRMVTFRIKGKKKASKFLNDVERARGEEEERQGEEVLEESDETSWAVEKLNAPTVWESGNTGQKTLVAVIDSGAAVNHPDLAPNIWVNEGETGVDSKGVNKSTNGIDDDANGYIDDVNGYNFEGKNGDLTDTNGHGSQTAGIVGGMGAGGIQTGVAPGAKMMILKSCCGVGGSTFESNTWEAIQYAMKMGAQVISMSMSAKPNTNPSYAKWRKLGEVELTAGIIHVNSAGNLGSKNAPRNIGCPATNPPAWFFEGTVKGKGTSMITIGATDQEDALRSYSSTGPVTWESIEEFKDFPYTKGASPGLVKPEVCGPSEMPSTSKDGKSYTKSFGGTSSATPSIAGVVALMVTAKPGLTPAQATEALVLPAVEIGQGYTNQCGGGRVNAVAAVEYVIKKF